MLQGMMSETLESLERKSRQCSLKLYNDMYEKLKRKLEKYGHTFDDQLWNEIQVQTQIINVKKNEVLIEYASKHQFVYFIVSGCFVKYIITLDGDKKSIWFHLDEVFTMTLCGDSYFFKEPTKYEVKALEDATVIKINKRDMDHWVLKYPTFNQFYLSDLVTGFMAINEIRAFTLAHNPEQIFSYVIDKYPSIIRRVPSKNFAHFLGVSPEWYSKLKKRMMH